MINYKIPSNWINYNFQELLHELVDAKSVINALKMIPFQKAWVDKLQQMQLKREVAGTSQIEGAVFTENELEDALKDSPEQLITRSQKQAHAAVKTYRWIAALPDEQPIDTKLIKEIHRRIIAGADDDHCEPGILRSKDQNVNFGQPRHRGVEGGRECLTAFNSFVKAIQRQYKDHDPIIQAISAHYHFVAMHPFLDGNGRTARALEALFLQRAGLRETCFIALSNYYYDEKSLYLKALNLSHEGGHDLTPFLKFALNGIVQQANRLMNEIKINMQKAIFRNTMYYLFNMLKSKRKRVIAERQLLILKLLLDNDEMNPSELFIRMEVHYIKLSNPFKAFIRDINGLLNLSAIKYNIISENEYILSVCLEWPSKFTETEFFKRLKDIPKAQTYKFLQ